MADTPTRFVRMDPCPPPEPCPTRSDYEAARDARLIGMIEGLTAGEVDARNAAKELLTVRAALPFSK